MVDKYFPALFSDNPIKASYEAASVNPFIEGRMYETETLATIILLILATVWFARLLRADRGFSLGISTAGPTPEHGLRCDAMADVGINDSKPLLLVAEDNMSNYKLLEVILRNEYKLVHALNGQIAVEMFDSLHPDLVLMDINMPVMDGYEAMRNIKERAPKAVVIALTAYAFESDRQKMLASGFDDFLAKPIKIIELKEMVASYVKAKR